MRANRLQNTQRCNIDPGRDNLQNGVGRRTTIQQVGGFDISYKIIADFEMLTKLAVSKKYVVANYDIPIAYFFVGGESQKLGSVFTFCKERYLISGKHHLRKFPLLHFLYSFFRTLVVRIVHKALYTNR